jgi:hypothetical protein
MSEGMAAPILSHAGFAQSDLHRPLHVLFGDMMAPNSSGSRIDREFLRGKDIRQTNSLDAFLYFRSSA